MRPALASIWGGKKKGGDDRTGGGRLPTRRQTRARSPNPGGDFPPAHLRDGLAHAPWVRYVQLNGFDAVGDELPHRLQPTRGGKDGATGVPKLDGEVSANTALAASGDNDYAALLGRGRSHAI